VLVREAYFDPDTRELLHVEDLTDGYIDFIDHVGEGGERRLDAQIVTSALDDHRDGYRSASNEDQQLVSAGDRGFEYASKVKTESFDIKF
jgi:hypothetical protein